MNTDARRYVSPLFLFLACLFVTCLLVSNIIAGKLIEVYKITLSAAVILFPLTYILGDVLTEVYGFERARSVIWMGFACNILMAFMFYIVVLLPYPDFWEGQSSYAMVLGFTPRLVLASLIAFWAGEMSNAMVLSKMKIMTQGKWLWTRTIGSTVVGEGIDTVIFIGLAFYGSVPHGVLLTMIIAQYLWKVAYEILATPITYFIVAWVKKREGYDKYDVGVTYNFFRWKITGN